MFRRSVVTVYIRHRNCKEAGRGCKCVRWLRWSMAGKQYKCTANTRSWQVADERRAELQHKLDAGETGSTLPAVEFKQLDYRARCRNVPGE
jgi:hypothetical protein